MPPENDVTERAGTDRTTRWMIGAVLLVLAFALILRYGSNVLDRGLVFDEPFIIQPIQDLLDRGWSVTKQGAG